MHDPQRTLSEQVAIVTGGSRGIGAAIARKLASLGAHVLITGRSQPPMTEVVQSITATGDECEAFSCDITQLGDVERLSSHVHDRYRRVDIVVNNAGLGAFGTPLHLTDPERWDQVLNTNLRGVYYMIRAFAPAMIAARSGHIINMSSLAGHNPVANAAAYAASKWGLQGLSYSVAEELRQHNVRVSVVCPGSTDTSLMPSNKPGSRPHILQPDDIAHVIAMLATQSPQSFVSEVLIRPTNKP